MWLSGTNRAVPSATRIVASSSRVIAWRRLATLTASPMTVYSSRSSLPTLPARIGPVARPMPLADDFFLAKALHHRIEAIRQHAKLVVRRHRHMRFEVAVADLDQFPLEQLQRLDDRRRDRSGDGVRHDDADTDDEQVHPIELWQ